MEYSHTQGSCPEKYVILIDALASKDVVSNSCEGKNLFLRINRNFGLVKFNLMSAMEI